MTHVGNRKHMFAIGVGCFLLAAAGLGMTGAKSQYIDAVCADLGYSTGFMTSMVSLSSLAMATTCLLFTPLQRILKSIRSIIVLGTIAISLGYVIPALLQNQLGFVIGFVLQGIGLASLADVPISTLVNNWFTVNSGTVLGICFMGSGIGGVIFNPITSFLIRRFGWDGSYLLTTVITIVLIVPVLLVGQDRPAESNKVLLRGGTYQDKTESSERLSILQVLRLPRFVPFLIVTLITGFCIPSVNHNASPILNGTGIDPAITAFIMSAIYASLSVAKVVMGFCNDRIGARATIGIQTGAYIISVLILIVMTEFLHSVVLGFIFAIAFGFSYSWQSLAQPAALRVLFDKKYFASCLSITVAILHFGTAISSSVAGFVKDATGSFTLILIIYAIVVSVSFVCYQLIFYFGAKETGT